MTGNDLVEPDLPVNALRAIALEAAQTGTDATIDLAHMDHLDTGSLQILLALAENRRLHGLHLHLTHASAALRAWFELSGALSFLPLAPQAGHD